jgi:hypothetical protein
MAAQTSLISGCDTFWEQARTWAFDRMVCTVQVSNQSINPSINHSINQSVSQSINQSISQSINQSRLTWLETSPGTCSIHQSINQSINQFINRVWPGWRCPRGWRRGKGQGWGDWLACRTTRVPSRCSPGCTAVGCSQLARC